MTPGQVTVRLQLVLAKEIAEIADIGHNLPLATDDPLGIGGLLFMRHGSPVWLYQTAR